MEAAKEEPRLWKLERECELRLEVPSQKEAAKVVVEVKEGTCEVFGTEMAQNNKYTFTEGTKIAFFSWFGCTLEVTGTCHAYIGRETPMTSYAQVHGLVERRRSEAAESEGGQQQGPRVIVVGPTDTGKSSLCRILLSYAARVGRVPTYLDLDVGQSCGVPGMLVALPVERPIDIVEGFEFTAPLVYFFGHASPGPAPDLYKLQIVNIMKDIEKRFESNSEARASGLIINTCGWVDGVGYELLKFAIEACKADVVLVMDQERLYSDLANEFARPTASGAPSIEVRKLNKSGGVVTRDADYRRKTRNDKIKQYFYGATGDLCPHSTQADLEEVSVYRVGGPQAPSSALPLGAERKVNSTRLIKATANQELLHTLVGVSHAKTPEMVLETNLAGLLYVSEVNTEKKKMMCLAPCPGPLPGKFLLVGSLKWFE